MSEISDKIFQFEPGQFAEQADDEDPDACGPFRGDWIPSPFCTFCKSNYLDRQNTPPNFEIVYNSFRYVSETEFEIEET